MREEQTWEETEAFSGADRSPQWEHRATPWGACPDFMLFTCGYSISFHTQSLLPWSAIGIPSEPAEMGLFLLQQLEALPVSKD